MKPLLVVTGGSRGIGAAVCRMAASRGYDIAINFQRDQAAANAVADDCRRAGVRAETFRGDMAREEDIVGVFAEVDRRLGRMTHLVNNAGILGRASRVDEVSAEAVRSVIDLNVTGAILVAREAIRRMAARHGGAGGVIVNLSSVAATLGAPGEFVWYAASKGAIDALTVGLAKELAEDGIRVNAVAPGLIDTEIHASAGVPGRIERLVAGVPLARIGTVDEVAESILFLLSDAASYITGSVLRVGGGR